MLLLQVFTTSALWAVAVRSQPTINWVNCSQEVPIPLDINGLDLDNLPSTLHCGRIDVPMDYTKIASNNNTITLGLAMYRPMHSKGVIFYNPGGSDAAAVVAWQVALNQTSDFSGLLDYDLMMMDVRGTYSSNPLNVSLDAFAGLLKPYPTNQHEYDLFRAASASVAQSWIDLSSPPAIVQHVGSTEVVQDFESIRVALGYDRINFLGASYGSFRAAQYTSAYPHRVDHFVLDAVIPHGLDIAIQAQDEIKALNRGLLRADAYCQNNASCPFHSMGKGSVPKAYQQILQAAEKAPLTAKSCINTTQCNAAVTPFDVQQGMQSLLLGQPDFPTIFKAFEGALAGDASAFAGGPIPDVALVWSMPLLCNDFYPGHNSFSSFEASLKAGLKLDTNNIGVTQAWQTQLWCSAWPFLASSSRTVEITAPMLLVTADFDNERVSPHHPDLKGILTSPTSAPTELTIFAWQNAANSGLVVRHGDDHVSFTAPDQPSVDYTKDFLRTGVLPAPTSQNETFATVYGPEMIRGPIPDPYEVPTGSLAGDIDSGE